MKGSQVISSRIENEPHKGWFLNQARLARPRRKRLALTAYHRQPWAAFNPP